MTERGRAGGSIRKMPGRDLWQGRYVAADGHRRSVYAATEKACQEELRKALKNREKGVVVTVSEAKEAPKESNLVEALKQSLKK